MYPRRKRLVSSTRVAGTAFFLIDSANRLSDRLNEAASAPKTFQPMKMSSGRIAIGTENKRCIVGNVGLRQGYRRASMAGGTTSPTKAQERRTGRMRLYVGEVINSQAPLFSVAEANWSLRWREMFSWPSRNQVNSRRNRKS